MTATTRRTDLTHVLDALNVLRLHARTCSFFKPRPLRGNPVVPTLATTKRHEKGVPDSRPKPHSWSRPKN